MFNETVRLLQDTAQSFVAQEIEPRAEAVDQAGHVPKDLWKKMGALGLLGVTVEEAYGGAGLGYLEHVVVMEAISCGSGSVGLSYGAHSNLCVNQIRLHGTESQKHRYLPDLVSGETVGALAMSESGSGSDVLSMRLSAEKKSDHYLLNGTKMWITNAADADVFVVYARTSPEPKGITAFIVEKSMKGFALGQKLDKLGMRGSSTGELLFQDCEVPEDNVLGKVHGGVSVLMKGLDYERVILAGGPVGLMQACMDTAIPYVRERQQFNRPIGSFQLVQGSLADMYTSTQSARAYVYATASSCDEGTIMRKDAASAILYASRSAVQVALEAIQLLGGNGYTTEYPLERFLRDAKLYEIGAGTTGVRRMLIGKELFKGKGL